MANLYILTEERPKLEVIKKILAHYCSFYNKNIKINSKPLILPNLTVKKFNKEYKLLNIKINGIKEIIIKVASGESSFVDFLIFEQNNAPSHESKNNLKMIIEETKTNDNESRNLVYQRLSKFVYVDYYYKNIPKIMLFNFKNEYNYKKPSYSNKFGIKLLKTLKIDIIGINSEIDDIEPFKTIDELIKFKSKMRNPPQTNVPILIEKKEEKIEISGRLEKPTGKGNIAHDPNIGQLTGISKILRILGWKKDIIITKHGVKQEVINRTPKKGNKFIHISSIINLKLKNIKIPKRDIPDKYWHYDNKSEKNGTILLHLISIFNNNNTTSIFENHGGCERGYFYKSDKTAIQIPKNSIPDLILKNDKNKEIIIIEGKIYSKLNQGLEQLEKFDSFENKYIKENYENYSIDKWLVTFGDKINEKDLNPKILFHLNENGTYILNQKAPEWLKISFKRVIDN